MFKLNDCAIPTVYCGKSSSVPKNVMGDDVKYVRKGKPYECVSKGFGAGVMNERTRGLPKNSLQRIKYVGDIYETKFKKFKINTINDLIKYTTSNPSTVNRKMFETVYNKKDGVFDNRAYNSTLMYLYKIGANKNLPSCIKITTS